MLKRLSAGLLVLGLLGSAAIVFESTLVDADEGTQVDHEQEETKVREDDGEEHKYPPVEHGCELKDEHPPWIIGRVRGESPQMCRPEPDCKIFWHHMKVEEGLGGGIGIDRVLPVREFPCGPPPCLVLQGPLQTTQTDLLQPIVRCCQVAIEVTDQLALDRCPPPSS